MRPGLANFNTHIDPSRLHHGFTPEAFVNGGKGIPTYLPTGHYDVTLKVEVRINMPDYILLQVTILYLILQRKFTNCLRLLIMLYKLKQVTR